jgi:hypothetical protein
MTPKIMSLAGQAKVLKTQRRVLDALAALSMATPAARLNITSVCGNAGVSPDALALHHHAELKSTVERSILEHNAAHFGKSRRKANPASDVAMSRIERLEQELADLRRSYASAVDSVRKLALALECALTEVEQLRFAPAASFADPPVSITRLKK